MNLKERVSAFARLGRAIDSVPAEVKEELINNVKNENAWFTENSIEIALKGITRFLATENLTTWTSRYALEPASAKKIGVAMAGNIPLVGFHDYLCILLSGHHLIAKLSSQDALLIQFLSRELTRIEPRFKEFIHFEELLKGVDAVIATGSDNTSRYFEYYFRNIPRIIRKNRTSCAVLLGEEPADQLNRLGIDVFTYFGLGCRNVSKLFVPEGYNFSPLLDSWQGYSEIIHHHKYANNYDYQKSILLVNGVPFLDNGFVMLTQNKASVSPISVLFYEEYKDLDDLAQKLADHSEKTQCIVSARSWYRESIAFGDAQFPEAWDYADNVDTLKFLSTL